MSPEISNGYDRGVKAARFAVTLGVCAALSLPVTYVAAAPPDLRPTGKALIAATGGTASVVKVAGGRYRLTLPGNARIAWLGEDTQRRLTQGTFTPARLRAAWKSLGHRRNAGVTTTLTWTKRGGESAWALTRLSNPRVNSNGGLVVDVITSFALPNVLKDYSVNIQRASSSPRSFPLVGRPAHLTDSVTMTTTAVSAIATTGVLSDGKTNCWTYDHSSTSNPEADWSGTCGGTKFLEVSVWVTAATATENGSEIAAYEIPADPSGKNYFIFKNVQLIWDINGNAVEY